MSRRTRKATALAATETAQRTAALARDHVFVTVHCPECLCASHAEPCTTGFVDRDGKPVLCNCTSAGR